MALGEKTSKFQPNINPIPQMLQSELVIAEVTQSWNPFIQQLVSNIMGLLK